MKQKRHSDIRCLSQLFLNMHVVSYDLACITRRPEGYHACNFGKGIIFSSLTTFFNTILLNRLIPELRAVDAVCSQYEGLIERTNRNREVAASWLNSHISVTLFLLTKISIHTLS